MQSLTIVCMPVPPDTLCQLLNQHAGALELYARQWCGQPADVVQEVFLKLSQQPTVPHRPAAWLFKVTRNFALASRRQDDRRRHREAATAGGDWFENDLDCPLDARTATDAMKALPDTERECIVAHLWGGLSFEEIATLMGVSSSTAHRQFSGGIEKLQKKLGIKWTKTGV